MIHVKHRARAAIVALAATLILAGCAPAARDAPKPSSTGADEGHGSVEGAREMSEPQLNLVSVAADGRAEMLDLLSEQTRSLDDLDAPDRVGTDGRYVFGLTEGSVEIVDGGVWTWDHVDHFHDYRAEPRRIGAVSGDGMPVVTAGESSIAGGTAVFFPASGEAVLLDNAALADGEVREVFRAELGRHEGVAAAVGPGALVSTPGGSVQYLDRDGEPVEGAEDECAEPSGAIATHAGVAIACAHGAVVATAEDGEVTLESVPYPREAATPATGGFHARKNRPTVASIAGDAGFWLLDVRELSWRFVETGQPVARVVASDDEDEHVITLGADGRVRVYSGGSEPAGETQVLVDDPSAPGVTLQVDAQRAYLNAPGARAVFEIDYADGARIARTFEPGVEPSFLAEVGR